MNYIHIVVNFINIDIVFSVTTLSKGINIFRQNLASKGIKKSHSWFSVVVVVIGFVVVFVIGWLVWFCFFKHKFICFL